MRLRLGLLVSVATCGSLAFGAAQASTSHVARSVHAGVSRADTASVWRTRTLTLSPAPGDLTLAEVSFNRSAKGQEVSASSLRVAVSGPFGDDYLAAATPRFATPAGPLALVLLVNRPSPLLDPVSVRLQLAVRGSLGEPVVHRLADPLTRPNAGRTPALCNLLLHGSALSASKLRLLRSRGAALAEFGAASAVAQAYDVVCGLPYASSFAQAVAGSAPAPTPGSPAPEQPGCTPCDPPPGYACPLMARPSICVAPAVGGVRRAAGGAH